MKLPFFELEVWQIVSLGGAFFVGVVFACSVFVFMVRVFVRKESKKGDLLKLRRRFGVLCGLFFLLEVIQMQWLAIPHNYYMQQFVFGVRFLVSLFVLLVANPMINAFFSLLYWRDQQGYGNRKGVLQIFSKGVKLVVFALLVVTLPKFVLLDYHDYDLGRCLTNLTIGASTVVAIIGFASKDLIGNFFGALVIIGERLFLVDDWIVVKGLEGRVVHIDVRATKLQTKEGNIVYVPNAMFTNQHITNHGRVSYQCFSVSIPYLSLEPGVLQGFLDKVRDVLAKDSCIMLDASGFYVDDIGEERAKLVFHLSFKTMASEELVGKVHGLMREVYALKNFLEKKE